MDTICAPAEGRIDGRGVKAGRQFSMHLSRLSVKTRRSLNLLVVVALLSASSAIAVAAMPATLEATPSNANGSRLYVGYDAQLTAEMPADWQPDMALLYDYAGSDGFVFSHSLDVSPRSLDVACAAMANDDRFAGHGQSQSTTWRDKPACVVRFSGGGNRGPVALVFAHPHPAEDGHNQFVSIFVDASHFDSVLETVSFDPAKVTADAYLDAAIDFAQTHSLWRDRIDWVFTRGTAHDLLANQLADQGLGRAYKPLQYVASQIRQAGGDGHNWFSAGDGAGETSVPASVPLPAGELLTKAIGYIAIPGFTGNDDQALQFATAGRGIIQDSIGGGACGWIVDLRMDTGGNMYPMTGVIAPLLPPGEVIRFRDANGSELAVTYDGKGEFDYDGQPMNPMYSPAVQGDGEASRQPVAVLIGPNTASAGEATALAFAGRDRTRFVGSTTARFTTGPTALHLFDDAILMISAFWMVGPHGAIYPDAIVPDVKISSGAVSQASSDDVVVQAAKEWLGRQPGCRDRGATPATTPLATPSQ